MFPIIRKTLKNLWFEAISGENWIRLPIIKSGRNVANSFLPFFGESKNPMGIKTKESPKFMNQYLIKVVGLKLSVIRYPGLICGTKMAVPSK